MNIIVAGGSGMIGQSLTEVLRRDGHQVYVLSRNPHAVVLPPGVEAVGWDGKTSQGWEALVEEANAIINLAGANIGERPWTNERKRMIRTSRTEPGAAIVSAVQKSVRKPAVVFQMAGVGYYGPRGDEILDEASSRGDDFLAGVGIDWENSTRPLVEMGVRRVIMRAGVVLSPKKGGVLDPFLLQYRLFAGGPLGSGRQWISWIHIRDLISAFQFLLEQEDASDVFNASSPEPVTNATFGRTLAKVMRRPYWLPVPALALKVILGEMSTIVLTGQRVLPKRLLKMGFQFQYPELRRALEEILRLA